MKQKIQIEVQINCEKCRRVAMKVASAQGGVYSVEMQGENRDLLVVVGEGVDSVALTKNLRKKVGRAVLFCVEEVKEEAVVEKEKVQEDPPECNPPCPPRCHTYVTYCEFYDPSPNPCSIM